MARLDGFSIRHPQSAIRNPLSRRDWLKLAAAGVTAGSMSGWLEALAAGAARNPQRKRACLLLWMSGGPAPPHTLAMKPGHPPARPLQTKDTPPPPLRRRRT